MIKWIGRALLVVLAVAIVGAAGGYLYLRTSLPTVDGTMQVAGLERPVTVTRDENGVPHIAARSQHDAYFALGVVHAQDRIWQMDFLRRLGQGRLSEVLGAPTAATDRYMRTLGLYRLAEESYRHLKAETRAALDAYAAGVNAWLTSRKNSWSAWPVEFYMLRYRPEPWRPADSLVWGRTMGLFLSRNWREELLRSRIAAALGPDVLPDLFPPYPPDAPVTLAGLPGNPLAEGSASNWWGLAGKLTASGSPLLANDPHLRFRAPGLWYLARVTAPGLDVTGATVAGMPFTVLGHNRDIAWGFTSAETDVQDLFIETVVPGEPGSYDTPDGPRRFDSREETIRVRDREDVVLTVRTTRHGPVVGGLSPELAAIAGPGKVVALAATSLLPDDRTADALFALNRASNWADFRGALRFWHSPQQNIVMADRTGDIGMIAAGRIPVRRNGSGDLPVPGAGGQYDWTGFVPFDDLPSSHNPASGRLINANNPVARIDGDAERMGRNRSPGYRARRIETVLSAGTAFDADAMSRLQMDSVSPMAQTLLPLLTRHARPSDAAARRALALLDGWDGAMLRGAPQPLIFTAWVIALKKAIFADELGALYPSWSGFRTEPIRRVLSGKTGWCDVVRTDTVEDCTAAVSKALEYAVAALAAEYGDDASAWRWGDAHFVRFDHPVLGRIPLLQSLFNVRLPGDGGSFTINRGHISPDNPRAPYASVHGAGLRAVYDLSDLSASRFMVAPGQSGNRLSGHYGDLAKRWRDGEYLIPGKTRSTASLKLIPARQE